MTSTEIRAIVRAELRRFLLHAADSFPPDPSLSSGPPDGLDAALDAWEALGGGEEWLTVGQAASRWRGGQREAVEAWQTLCDALGLAPGERDARSVGMGLARLAGRAGVDGRRLVGRMDTTRKVRRWRVTGVAGAVDVAPGHPFA